VIFFAIGKPESRALLKKANDPPWFPSKGVFIIGQEQEQLCGGFDNYDSLSADITQFQVIY